MKASEQTLQQIERALRKVAAKYPQTDEEHCVLTDIHLLVNQDSGELLAYNDNDDELTRCVVEEWIDNKSETFYDDVQQILKGCIANLHDVLDNLGLLKPYSFVLIGDDKETIAELYLVDDNTMLLDGDLMKGLDRDLDNFLNQLLESK